MSTISLTRLTFNFLEEYTGKANIKEGSKTGRLLSLAFVFPMIFTSFVDGLTGNAALVVSKLFLPKNQKISAIAKEALEGSEAMLCSYIFTMQFLNPAKQALPEWEAVEYLNIEKFCDKQLKSSNFFNKQIVSRLIIGGCALVEITVRVGCLVIGILAAAFSVVTAGRIPKLNHFTFYSLKEGYLLLNSTTRLFISLITLDTFKT